MRELRGRATLILGIICAILAVLLLYQLGGIIHRWNPFRGAHVPELPTLTSATNAAPGATHATNQMTVSGIGSTNTPARGPAANSAANIAAKPGTKAGATNFATATATNVATATATNVATATATNSAMVTVASNAGSNVLALAAAAATNAPAASKPKKHQASGAPMDGMAGSSGMAGMDFGSMQPMRKGGAQLPPAVQARIQQIIQSEILAPVMHPLPMGLLGIAGEFAFLRSDSGQTGMEKVGDTLDDIKLLRIGINRVLIEQDGKKKELLIFDGYGGDSLLPKDSTNENNHP